jgi:hypothetical protein
MSMSFDVVEPVSFRADEVVAVKETGAESDYQKSILFTEWEGSSAVLWFENDEVLRDLGVLALSLVDSSRSYSEVFQDQTVPLHARDVALRPSAGELLPQTAAEVNNREARIRLTIGDAPIEVTARVEHWLTLLEGLQGLRR